VEAREWSTATTMRICRFFLLAAYGKNEKANLSKAERNAMARLVPALIQTYSEGSRTKR